MVLARLWLQVGERAAGGARVDGRSDEPEQRFDAVDFPFCSLQRIESKWDEWILVLDLLQMTVIVCP